MSLPTLAAATLGLTAFAFAGAPLERPFAGAEPLAAPNVAAPVEGPAALVGERLWASEAPIARWGEPVRAEDLPLDDLGVVAAVVTGPDGEAEGLVVAVGGLWGFGAREVEMGLDRIHRLPSAGGAARLVVDLSADGAAPPPEGLDA